MNIYVNNLSIGATQDELKRVFTVFGEVKRVVIVCDERASGCEAGRYAYVEMPIKSEGTAAISNLNGKIIGGRVVCAIEALPLSDKKIETLSRKELRRLR